MAEPTKVTVLFPEGEREVAGITERRDILMGVEFIIPHPYYSQLIDAPKPMDGYRFRQIESGWIALRADG